MRSAKDYCFGGNPAGGRSLGGVVCRLWRFLTRKKPKQDTLPTVKQELHRIMLRDDLYRGEG